MIYPLHPSPAFPCLYYLPSCFHPIQWGKYCAHCPFKANYTCIFLFSIHLVPVVWDTGREYYCSRFIDETDTEQADLLC